MQLNALKRARRAGGAWVGFLDADEYLHVPGADLPALLSTMPQAVGAAAFQWEMIPAGTTYAAVGRVRRGTLNQHVKSFVHSNRTIPTEVDPHHKVLRDGFIQYLVGANKQMENGPIVKDVSQFGDLKSPTVLHFHAKATLVERIRKVYRGTGDVNRKSDTMPLKEAMTTFAPQFISRGPPTNQTWSHQPFDAAFAALVNSVAQSEKI
tara:strand:+ start:179 stop:802 length:624 start_codon:yes stop_codon:yes gene_type:complete